MNRNYNIGVEVNFENKNTTTQMIFYNKEINKFILENNIVVTATSLNITNTLEI